MNPILFVPFIVAPMVNATVAWFAVSGDLIGRAISLVPWTAPAPIGAAWGAGWQFSNGIHGSLIALDLVIYPPFFKIYENNCWHKKRKMKQK